MTRRRVLLLLALALAAFVIKMLVDAGVFRTITPHFAGQARTLAGIPGPEDVEHSAPNQLLFISSDNRPERHGEPTPDGAILGYRLDDPAAQPVNLTKDFKPGFAFHPHGMAIWELADGTRLWVVNHRADETSVEVFVYRGGKLTFEKSIRDPLLAVANDLLAVDAERFYATSDHASDSHLAGKLEDYTRIGRGYVSFYDGKTFSKKATGLRYANGLCLSGPVEKPSKLLVAAMLAKSVHVYDRDAATGDLREAGVVRLDSAPDNITCDPAGVIWVGAHPKLFALKAMNDHRTQRAPSVVLKITGIETATPRVEEVMADDGRLISAASVAWHRADRLIVGSVFDDRLLDCVLR